MKPATNRPGSKTIADWLAQPEDLRLELIDGEFVQKAAPDEPHSDAQAAVIGILRPEFNRRGGSGHRGGWWIRSEIDIELRSLGFRPEVAGWRRERVPPCRRSGRSRSLRTGYVRSYPHRMRQRTLCASCAIVTTPPFPTIGFSILRHRR